MVHPGRRRRGGGSGSLLVILLQLSLLNSCFAFSGPKITKDSMAGLWKLTGITSELSVSTAAQQSVHYIKLNDDGSFQAMENAADSQSSMLGLSTMQGTWDYRDNDGQLILAADRPEDADICEVHDTVLEGKVHYKQTEAMCDESSAASMLDEDKEQLQRRRNEQQGNSSPQPKKMQTWFSVPMGSIQIGKFFYPKSHPSFFENPIYNPTNMGTFSLAQVLSNHPVEEEDMRFVEKFKRDDFIHKKFWLTSYPIPDPKPKGEDRWSLKYGKYVKDPPRKQEKKTEDPAPTFPIRVLQVVFYSNYTFAITDGAGSAIQLRGNWDIWGEERDLFWMQISRFGFGRNVSGSTYSEGDHLSHDDCKWYRGNIKEASSTDDGYDAGGDNLLVNGEVYLGKVTPYREALFMLKEAHDEDDDDDDEDGDDDDDEDAPIYYPEPSSPPANWSDAFQ